jgi:anti-sigma regulatory factor (Ser/Thr protein kinase)
MAALRWTAVATFEHAALVYDGQERFSAAVLPFVRAGIEAGEPTMVAVGAERLSLLRDQLGDAAGAVDFVDMGELGRNPGRIIPAWAEFLEDHAAGGEPVRGVGEPVWAGRSPAELVECQLHESLLNMAFAGTENFQLVCPYDRTTLDGAVMHEACRSHPALIEEGTSRTSASYRNGDGLLAPFDAPLPPPRGPVDAFAFDRSSIDELRTLIGHRAALAGLTRERAADFVLAVNEVAANSIRHAGGYGVLRVWREDCALVSEVRDPGVVADPLIGRRRPTVEQTGGWGVYIAHQVCDLVQLRSGAHGTVVRLHMGTPTLSESSG